jgi:zinc protease
MRKLPIRHTDKEQRVSNPYIPFTIGLREQDTCHSGPTLQWPVFRPRVSAIGIVGGLCLLLLALWLPPRTADATEPAMIDPRTLTFKAIEFVQPEPDRVVLENGMVIYLLEDHELPLITIGVLMRTGGWLDPPDKVGLAALTGNVMLTGGGGGLSAAEVDDELAQFAGRMTIAIDRQSGSASIDVMRKDIQQALRLFAGVVRTPAFDSARVELAKLQAMERIRRREDEPESIASREFTKLLYGPGHPSARESSTESVARIRREDLIAFHQNTIHPNGIILGVTGDFVKDEMVAWLREAFGDWQRGTVPEVRIDDVPESEAARAVVHFISKDTSQTHLRAGRLSVKETDADYVPLLLANDILGGNSLIGRLFNEVRTKRGLAYSVGSELSTGMYNQGMWLVWAETKLPSTKEVLGQLVGNIERMRTEPVSDAELTQAKDSYVNSSVFDVSSSAKIVSRLMKLEYDGLPKDFYQQLREEILTVSKEDILAVSRKHLRADHMKIVAVGSGVTLSEELATFGNVKEISLNSEGEMQGVMTSQLCFDSSQRDPPCSR